LRGGNSGEINDFIDKRPAEVKPTTLMYPVQTMQDINQRHDKLLSDTFGKQKA
jgi:hypothetical protein